MTQDRWAGYWLAESGERRNFTILQIDSIMRNPFVPQRKDKGSSPPSQFGSRTRPPNASMLSSWKVGDKHGADDSVSLPGFDHAVRTLKPATSKRSIVLVQLAAPERGLYTCPHGKLQTTSAVGPWVASSNLASKKCKEHLVGSQGSL